MVEMSESSRWEKELAQFEKVLAEPAGQAIVIVGPAGSGKSRLLTSMVMRGEKGEKFHFEGKIHHVGPTTRPNDVLREIGKWAGGVVAPINATSILGRLEESVREFGDSHRRVVGVDAKPKQTDGLERWWMEIISQLPEKVKFIFTQRPDDILATNEQFMGLANVVRIDVEMPLASDEKNQKNETVEPYVALQNDFIKFLEKEKGYPSTCLQRKQIPTATKHGLYTKALFIILPNSDEIITTIGFFIDDDPKVRRGVSSEIHNQKQFLNREHHYKQSIDLGYIVTFETYNPSYPFSIYEVIDGGNPKLIDIEDFPAYEELRMKVDTKTEASGGEDGAKNDVQAIFEQALKALENSEYDKAIKLCDNALSINPNHMKALQLRGIIYSRSGKYDEAIKQFDLILQKEPNNVGALEGKGLALLNKNDYAATYYTFEFLAKIDPSNIIAWHSMGEAQFYRNSFDEAIVCLDKAITINPHSDRSWVMKAKALLKKRKHEDAINCFDEALKHAANKSYVLLEKGIAYRELGNKSEEFYCYDRAIENDPKYIQAYMQKAYSLSQGEDYVGAIECFKKGIDNELEPEKEAILWHNLAETYLRIRNYEEAYRSINRSLELYDNEHTRMVRDAIEGDMSSKGAGGDDENVDDFKRDLTDIGKELFGKLIELIKSDPAFVIKPATSNYINIRIKKPRRAALQIHKVADDPSQLGIAIAGWSEQDPEIRNKYAIVRRDIGGLSGFSDNYNERCWLEGKIKSKAKKYLPPYKAKVYIIDPGMQEDEEAWGELRGLLQYAKEVTGKGDDEGKVESTIQEHVKVQARATAKVIDKLQPRGMSVAEHGWGDKVAHKDYLGFRPYVEVVARFLTHEETELPLTLSVEGEWGSGKSSFLSQLKNEIGKIYKEKDQETAFIVEFDPWRHDKDEALWAAFVLRFIGQVSGKLGLRKRLYANMSLKLAQYNWREGWIDFVKVVGLIIVWLVVTGVLVTLVYKGVPLDQNGNIKLPGWIGSTAVIAGALFVALGKVKDFLGSPLAADLKKYMRRPDYVSKVSFIEKFHDDFKKIVSAYAGEERVYVFVDDLDRCNVPKAAELMESISLMISENPKLVFVMGMDREKVAAGLAVKHEKLLPYLAGQTEKKEVDKDEVKRLRGVRYGYSFIEKFIQVPFSLPQPDEKSIGEMLMGMSGQIKEEKKTTREKQEGEPIAEDIPVKKVLPDERIGETPKTETADVPQKQIEPDKELEEKEHAIRQEQIKEEFLKFDGDDPTFRAIVLMVSKAFDYNPRRAKQFVNIFRLRAATAKVTGLYEPKDGKRLTFEQLGKFVGIGLGWPLLIRDIERRSELLEELVEKAEGGAEGKANEKKPKGNGLYFERWADNEKLMELLKAGCENKKDAEKCLRFSLKGLDVKKLLQVTPPLISVEEEMV
jgi:tetratricopeptide (TPR) repeat protein